MKLKKPNINNLGKSRGAVLFSLIVVLLVIGFFIARANSQNVASTGIECNDLPFTTVTQSVPTTNEYELWVYTKTEDTNNELYVKVDDGSCKLLNSANSTDWGWISLKDSLDTIDAGTHDFSFYVSGAEMNVDKFILTNDMDCTPIENGENCVEFALSFEVGGLSSGQVLTDDELRAQLEFLHTSDEGVEVSYAFNTKNYTILQSAPPYCITTIESDSCEKIDLELEPGNHTLLIEANSPAGQNMSRVIPFTITKENNANNETNTNKVAERSDAKLFELVGITDGDIVSEGRNIYADPFLSNNNFPVTFRLDGEIIVSRDTPPYCLGTVGSNGECGDWDSTSVANGPHVLEVTSPTTSGKDVWQKYGFDVNNNSSENIIDGGETTSTIILGNGHQEAKGLTSILLPKESRNSTSSIRLSIDDELIYENVDSKTNLELDTKRYVNGTYRLLATLSFTNGNILQYASDVSISNNWQSSLSTWISQNVLMTIGSSVLMGVALLISSYIFLKLMHHQKFIKSRNILDYDKTVEEFLFKRLNRLPRIIRKHLQQGLAIGISILAGLLIGTYAMLNYQGTIEAKGLGFIGEIEDGVTSDDSPFAIGIDGEKKQVFIKLGDGSQKLVSQHTGHDSHNSDGSPNGSGMDGETPDDVNSGENNTQSPNEPNSGGGGTSSPTPTPGTTPTTPTPGTTPTQGCTPGSGNLGPMGPCINNSLIPASVLGISTRQIDNVAPASAASGGEPGAFRQRCDFSHMNYDDPVLFPNQQGAAHLHTYFGNNNTNYRSTSTSLKNSGRSTCAGGTFNRSAYWVPSMIDSSTGRPIRPNDERTIPYHSDLEIYYKQGYQGVGYRDVRPFPDGLQMIAGNASNATGPSSSNSRVRYYCEEGDNQWSRFFSLPSSSTIPSNCPRGDIVVMTVDFPQCWDGNNLTTPNGRSHLAYGTWQPGENEFTEGCPGSHPVGIPSVQMIVRWTVDTNSSATWRLSSDNYTSGPGGYSGHADYVFAWEDNAFQTVKEYCYIARADCGYQLGNGREPRWTRSR